MSKQLDNLLRQWTQIGAGFSAEPDGMTPDLERLLLDTARHAHEMARLFIMAAAWLHRYGDLRGDLRASVLASLRFDPGAGTSEVSLAEASGGSRAQVRNALDNLELTGRVRRLPNQGEIETANGGGAGRHSVAGGWEPGMERSHQ